MSNPQFAFCNAGTPSLVPAGGQTMAQADTTQAETIRQAARFLLSARYVMTLTGAGISVESGIPPFRGPGGLWTKYGEPPMDGDRKSTRLNSSHDQISYAV